MQRLQAVDHAHGIMVGEIEARRILETFVPQFVPEDSYSGQLMTDNQRLDLI